MSRTSQIQQLYVGLLGRAADAEGLQYWNGTGLSIAEIANWIVESAEEFPRTDRDDAVVALYANLFNREPDAEGRNYWVNESQVSIDELVLHLIEWADPTDAAALSNRTFVADAYTRANAGEELDLEAAAAVIADVDHTTKSVTDALDTIDGGAADAATDVQKLLALEEAKAAVLEAADLPVDVGTAINGQVASFNSDHGTTLAANSTSAQRTAIYNAERAELDLVIATAQVTVGTNQTAVNNLNSATEVSAYISANSVFANADKAKKAAQAKVAGALAEYDGLNGASDVDVDAFLAAAANTVDKTGVTVDDVSDLGGLVKVANPTAAGEHRLALADNVSEAENPGVTALVDALNALLPTVVAEAQASELLDTAKAQLNAATGGTTGSDLVDALLASQKALADAQKAAQDLEGDIARLEGLFGLKDQLDDLDKQIDEVKDSLEDDGFNVVDWDYDSATPVLASGTGEDDLFIFVSGAQDITISGFGFAGEDTVYFGEGYSLVPLQEGQAINQNVGDINALEIFWTQTTSGLTLWVENETFAGNATHTQDLTKITLTGVSMEDVSFEGGLLVA